MPESKQTLLVFELILEPLIDPKSIFDRFHPQGKTVLNRTKWQGKEPRSCGVTKLNVRSVSDPRVKVIVDIEVAHRPKGCINFVGKTRYDGWTMMVLDQTPDGTLLNGRGQPISAGEPEVYLAYSVYEDIEFNEIDFGRLVKEVEVDAIKRVDRDEVLERIQKSSKFSMGIKSAFMAAHRNRPSVKIVISHEKSGTAVDGFGTRIINVSKDTPRLKAAIIDHVNQLISGFVEGRLSLSTITNGELVLVDLNDIIVDCTANPEGGDSRFDCFSEFVNEASLEDLVQRLTSTYLIDVDIVVGKKPGLVIKRQRTT